MTKKECRAALTRLDGAVDELFYLDDRINAVGKGSAEEDRACLSFDGQVRIIISWTKELLDVER